MSDRIFVLELKVAVESVNSVADVARLKELAEALEATARDHGGETVITEVRWS